MIFDLWDTLVEWPIREAEVLRERLAALVSVSDEEFADRWSRSYRGLRPGPWPRPTGSSGSRTSTSRARSPPATSSAGGCSGLRPGATRAPRRLRADGIRLAVLSVCSEEVPAVWAETELAGLFDVETFSSECGLMKPEPEIYLQHRRGARGRAGDCLFVGDGANDELDGAERVGMTPVLFLPAGQTTPWPEVRAWAGLRVTSIEEVRELC